MNRQPYKTPPRWWSPRLSPTWVRLWRAARRKRGNREHGLVGAEIRGLEHLRSARQSGCSLLITPNHPTHADPYPLLEAADRFGSPFFFMTAWQVFAMTHAVGRHVLQFHGCFSINREGHDVRAVRQAVQILEQGVHPLVIFPEGEVFHLNDRVTPFRKGAVTVAGLAARRGDRPVACVPCALKFRYVDDPMPELQTAMDRLEQSIQWTPRRDLQLVERIRKFAEQMLCRKETEYFGQERSGRLQMRIWNLVAAVLGRLEDRYRLSKAPRVFSERVKRLRRRVIHHIESMEPDDPRLPRAERDLDDLFFAVQLYSYPVDYLAGKPSVERLAETIDKLEEDVFHVHRAKPRGKRRAVVAFGEPLVVDPRQSRSGNFAERLTRELQQRVQMILNELNAAPHVKSEGDLSLGHRSQDGTPAGRPQPLAV